MNDENIPIYSIIDAAKCLGYDWWYSNDYFIGTEDISITLSEEPYKKDFYTLIIQLEGWLTFKIDDKLITLEENSFFALDSERICYNFDKSENCKIQIVLFTKEFLDSTGYHHFIIELFQYFSDHLNGQLKLSKNEVNRIIPLYNLLLLKRETIEDNLYIEIIRSLIMTYILEFSHICLPNVDTINSTRNIELSNNFKKSVFKNCLKEKNVKFYADELCVTSNHLFKIIKSTTGRTPKHFIDFTIISLAKIQLKKESITISEAASLFPFSDLQSFSKFFKKHTGLSPQSYRLKWKDKML
ncbi:AraC family transcriptional regulator [Elizabethkingia anophelis]|nr:AraC family transcriptional regulator [Elizabethkingia anophelis]MCT4209650.1 AraC family transcriptional regulator [Elizabethkingia anophelis]